ncbi:hypothetical protein DV515_00001625, partial [Chloebia gouldiae]
LWGRPCGTEIGRGPVSPEQNPGGAGLALGASNRGEGGRSAGRRHRHSALRCGGPADGPAGPRQQRCGSPRTERRGQEGSECAGVLARIKYGFLHRGSSLVCDSCYWNPFMTFDAFK